ELEEVALATEVSMEEAEAVLRVLQSCEPAGVGARNLRECLLLQLRDAQSFERKLARKIVRECMDEFVARRTSIISRKFRVLPGVVESAFDEILSLNPFPGENFVVSHSLSNSSKSVGVTPDLKLSRTDQGWTVDVLGPD